MPQYGYKTAGTATAPGWTVDGGTVVSCLATQDGVRINHVATNPTGTVNTQNYAFAVVGTDTIDGVMFEIYGAVVGDGVLDPPDRIITIKAKLTKDGANPVGDFRTAAPIGNSATFTLGSSTDLWGTTLTAAEVNAATFGLLFYFEADINPTDPVAVDRVRGMVYTSSQGGAGPLTGLASKFRRIPGFGHKEREAASRKS